MAEGAIVKPSGKNSVTSSVVSADKLSIPVADELLIVSVAKEGAAALSRFTLEVDGIGRFSVITFSLLDVGGGETLAGKLSIPVADKPLLVSLQRKKQLHFPGSR